MENPIDNFRVTEHNLLRFDEEGEFYMILVLKRRKDTKGKSGDGVTEENRLIKHFFVYDKEYFRKKEDAIKVLCEQNNARAYILPQRRSCRLVLWALHDKVSSTLKDGGMNVHFDHLIRSSVAGMHNTAEKCHKRWVIDIDSDDEATFKKAISWRAAISEQPSDEFVVMVYASWIAYKIRRALVLKGNDRTESENDFMPRVGANYVEDDVTLLKTPHGFHIVTPPFNREQTAMQRYFGVGAPLSEWIKPDAMALLYSPVV